tara:strand:+ start:366 stop:569 length:204 start_codon:yes stop_codon:yes gene_type:complete
MNKAKTKEIIKNKNKENLFLRSDLIHFNLGPTIIKNKKGTKNGMISLLKKGGPTDIFSDVKTSKKIG